MDPDTFIDAGDCVVRWTFEAGECRRPGIDVAAAHV
jgi:hypothetical protein